MNVTYIKNQVPLAIATFTALVMIFGFFIDIPALDNLASGLQRTNISIVAAAGIVGGWAVTRFGFDPVFIVVGILGLVGVALLFGLRNQIRGVFDHGLHFSLKDIFNDGGVKK